MFLDTSLPALSQSHILPTSDSSSPHYFLEIYFPFLNRVHLCFPMCIAYYQAALLISSRINFCTAFSLIHRPISHSWPSLSPPSLRALSVLVSFISNPLAICVFSPPTPAAPRFLHTSHQWTEQWPEKIYRPFSYPCCLTKSMFHDGSFYKSSPHFPSWV